MALDPQISLGIRPVQIPLPQIQSPLERFQRVQSLRDLMMRGQLYQANIEQTQLENRALQEKARRIAAMQTLLSSGQRPTETQMLAAGGTEAPGFLKSLSDADKARLDAFDKFTETWTRQAQGIATLPDEPARAAEWARAHSQLKAVFPQFVDDNLAQYPGNNRLQALIQRGLDTKGYLDNIRSQAEFEEKKQLWPLQRRETEAKTTDAETKSAMSRAQMNAVQLAFILRSKGPDAYDAAVAQLPEAERPQFAGLRAEKDVLNAGRTPQEISQSYQAAMPKDADSWIARSKDPNLPQETRDYAKAVADAIQQYHIAIRPQIQMFNPPANVGATGPVTIDQVPARMRGEVKKIAEYRGAMPTLSRNSPYNQELAYWVNQINPTYDATQYVARNKTQSDFSPSGKSGKNITSFNTAIGHLGTLYDASERLDNSAFRGYNNFANWLSRQTGQPTVKPFEVARIAVSAELATALKGGVATQGEVEQWEKTINAADSPQQLRATIKTIVELMASRIQAMEDSYTGQMNRPPDAPYIHEKSRKVLDKIASGGAGAPRINTKEEYDKLPSGAQYVDAQDGKTYTKGR